MHYLYSKDGFTYGHSLQYRMLLDCLHIDYIDLLKLKAYTLFEISDADLSWLLFLKKLTCVVSVHCIFTFNVTNTLVNKIYKPEFKFTTQSKILTMLGKKDFENIVEKGENAGN